MSRDGGPRKVDLKLIKWMTQWLAACDHWTDLTCSNRFVGLGAMGAHMESAA